MKHQERNDKLQSSCWFWRPRAGWRAASTPRHIGWFLWRGGSTGLSGGSRSLPSETGQDASQCPAGNPQGALQPLLLASRWHVPYAAWGSDKLLCDKLGDFMTFLSRALSVFKPCAKTWVPKLASSVPLEMWLVRGLFVCRSHFFPNK